MTTLEATYRVVTPLFCGGADPSGPARLRLASFKGVLRYWWRALAPGTLSDLERQENELFGSADTGQSRVALSLRAVDPVTSVPVGSRLMDRGTVVGEGARYLGYGLMEAFASRTRGVEAGQLQRPCLPAPFELRLALRCRQVSEGQIATLTQALKCLGMLGGLGARSRRGYGSMALASLTRDGEPLWQAPSDLDSLGKELSGLLRQAPELPEHTAFSKSSRIVLLEGEAGQSALSLLDRMGREMVRYRSWGNNGRVLGNIDSEKNFAGDHDLMKLPPSQRDSHPERIVFGLPHNCGRTPDKQVEPAERGLDRRASPLFLHIHQLPAQPVAVVALLPARFLPEGRDRISVGGQSVPMAAPDALYRPLHTFLSRLLGKDRQESFRSAREVR